MSDLSRALTLGALLVGALSLFTPAPAEAQSTPTLAAVDVGDERADRDDAEFHSDLRDGRGHRIRFEQRSTRPTRRRSARSTSPRGSAEPEAR